MQKKVHIGPKGGQYIMRHGKKQYLKNNFGQYITDKTWEVYKKKSDIPCPRENALECSDFIDNIMGGYFRDPVRANDGIIYERSTAAGMEGKRGLKGKIIESWEEMPELKKEMDNITKRCMGYQRGRRFMGKPGTSLPYNPGNREWVEHMFEDSPWYKRAVQRRHDKQGIKEEQRMQEVQEAEHRALQNQMVWDPDAAAAWNREQLVGRYEPPSQFHGGMYHLFGRK